MTDTHTFTFIDLFAGIGGFHIALEKLGGNCVGFSEIDKDAIAVYQQNFPKTPALGDITKISENELLDFDVLVGGFPCQPFSKSGKQLGMNEARGTLFYEIAKIIKVKLPKLVLLENVKNLVGPKHKHEWGVIIKTLRDLGYKISDKPLIISPNHLPPEFGGERQERERVLLCCHYSPDSKKSKPKNKTKKHYDNDLTTDGFLSEIKAKLSTWDKQDFRIADLPPDDEHGGEYNLSDAEIKYLEVWDDFQKRYRKQHGYKLPGFPLWADFWQTESEMEDKTNYTLHKSGAYKFNELPFWKQDLLRKNAVFYEQNESLIKQWKKDYRKELEQFPPSKRKLEWQAGDELSIADTILHFRPSGIRCKRPNYTPALVAITQTTVLGKNISGEEYRYITPKEATNLQSFPVGKNGEDIFDFSVQSDAATYKQLGNAVNVNVIYWTFREYVEYFQNEITKLMGEEFVQNIMNKPRSGYEVEWKRWKK